MRGDEVGDPVPDPLPAAGTVGVVDVRVAARVVVHMVVPRVLDIHRSVIVRADTDADVDGHGCVYGYGNGSGCLHGRALLTT
ncbi:hypothetical protein San01_34040 [Streptomyces angustmyceticus]|uniref:Uncharacterized protein n=1 Tax=Streptomyces angustmyceticus TaxID=285578 RepID=A0A5J4L974_9ACTN|nr:hypothetical protein San01_34040 [Streptomyces angustmyceticus]